MGEAESGLWRERLAERANPGHDPRNVGRGRPGWFVTVIPGDEAWRNEVGMLGDRTPLWVWADGDADLSATGNNLALRQLAGLSPSHTHPFKLSILQAFDPTATTHEMDEAESLQGGVAHAALRGNRN